MANKDAEQLEVFVDKPFGNLYRPRTVLVACVDDDCRVVMTGKDEYPDGIVRLPGGGVRVDEDPAAAAAREIGEELKSKYRPEDMRLLKEINVDAVDSLGTHYSMTTYLYYLWVNGRTLEAGDDVKNIQRLGIDQMNQMVGRFLELSNNLRRVGDGEDFRWRDYGQVYGPIHAIAIRELIRMNLVC